MQVAGVDEYEANDFADGRTRQIVIEACLGLTTDIGAQKLLDGLLDTVPAAVEADNSAAGALFSRLQEDGTVLAAQPAAADSVNFVRYRGQSRFTLRNGTEVLLASWQIQVIT